MSTSKKTRSPEQSLQDRLLRQDPSVTLGEIRLFFQDRQITSLDRDIRNKIINYFGSEAFVQDNYEQLADFFNDVKIHDELKKLLLPWVGHFITIPKLQELAEKIINNPTFKDKIYADVIDHYINDNNVEDARMILEKIGEQSKKQSLQAQIVKKQKACKRIRQKQSGGGKRKQQPIQQLIQQGDTSVTFDELCDFLRGLNDPVYNTVYNRYIIKYFSSTEMLKENYNKLATFFNDTKIREYWRRLALTYVPLKITDSSLLQELAENLTTQKFKQDIMRSVRPTDNTPSKNLQRQTKTNSDSSTGLQGLQGLQGGVVTVKNLQRQTKQNSDSSTGLLGLGAVAVGVFLVVLLGVRYRK